MEVTRRRGRRRKKLLDDLKDRRGYCHLKEEALDLSMWRNRFGGGFGPVARQNTEWMNSITVVACWNRGKPQKTTFRTVDSSARIWTEYLPSKRLERVLNCNTDMLLLRKKLVNELEQKVRTEVTVMCNNFYLLLLTKNWFIQRM